MVALYVRLIEAGRKSLLDINNTSLRSEVRKALIADGCEVSDDDAVVTIK